MGLINILSNYYKVFAIDLPMHGKSEKPKQYLSIKDISIILKKLLNKLNIKNPTICAHSAGCLIAIEFASKNKTKELLLIEPAGINEYDSKALLFLKIVIVKILSLFTNPLNILNDSNFFNPLKLGSKASLIASPVKLQPRTTKNIAIPGNRAIHQA